MTLEQFDNTLGYLLKVVTPPSVGPDDPLDPSLVLDVLLKHVDQVRALGLRPLDPKVVDGIYRCPGCGTPIGPTGPVGPSGITEKDAGAFASASGKK